LCDIIFILWVFFSSRRRHTRFSRDWSSDVCSSDLFNCDRDMASSIICETADSIRGFKNGGGRIGKTAAAMVERIVEAKSKEDLRSEERRVGKECRPRGSPYRLTTEC